MKITSTCLSLYEVGIAIQYSTSTWLLPLEVGIIKIQQYLFLWYPLERAWNQQYLLMLIPWSGHQNPAVSVLGSCLLQCRFSPFKVPYLECKCIVSSQDRWQLTCKFPKITPSSNMSEQEHIKRASVCGWVGWKQRDGKGRSLLFSVFRISSERRSVAPGAR